MNEERLVSGRWRRLTCTLVILLGVGCSDAAALDDDKPYFTSSEFDDAYADVKACFAAWLLKEKKGLSAKDPLNELKLDDLWTQQLLLDYVAAHHAEISETGAKELCEQELLPGFIKLVESARVEVEAKEAEVRAPLGISKINTNSFWINLYHNYYGRHARGHADLTYDAISQLLHSPKDRNLNYLRPQVGQFSDDPDTIDRVNQGINYLMRASQAPDLYRWNTESYHAHSPQFRQTSASPASCSFDKPTPVVAGELPDVCASIEIGIADFSEIFVAHFRDMRNRHGDLPQELMHLGTLLHMTQDLVYHHGMTLMQHSGLAYIDGYRNPDEPCGFHHGKRPESGSAADKIEQEAIAVSRWLISTGLAGSDMADARTIGELIATDTFDDTKYDACAKKALWLKDFPRCPTEVGRAEPDLSQLEKQQSMTVSNLWTYYKLASAYGENSRQFKPDLGKDLIKWPEPSCLLNHVVDAAENNVKDFNALALNILKQCPLTNVSRECAG